MKAFTLRFFPDKRGGASGRESAVFHLPPGDYTLRCKWNDARPDVAHEGEWTGELVSADHKFTLAAPGAPASETLTNLPGPETGEVAVTVAGLAVEAPHTQSPGKSRD